MTKPPHGLSSSLWAGASSQRARSLPPPIAASQPPTTPPRERALARLQALHRFEQVCRRLRWKTIDLENAYQRASAPQPWGFDQTVAEQNFKIDFHEFYRWIEQAVVLLFKSCGTIIERTSHLTDTQHDGASPMAAHAYHHNVLKALGDEEHPLHASLGNGSVNQALWKAKELRNKWKPTAEDRQSPPLQMYDLSWIITQIMEGLEAAYAVASARVTQDLSDNEVAMTDDERHSVAEEEWEWMVEPMDWEV
ncbi:fungal specific transcription factor [Purpureocillium lavendulum]|uniref:Fungal specific transcription factor n=1 Tax=Purpureocillium lavendulum TaxID=1247861 RepID=A0AB34FG93_9HYPO|nr:fungal specific transcription factor [Purpureocillium lavendulum]